MGKSEKKMGRVKASDKRRSAVVAPVTAIPPHAVRPRIFTARIEWTETRECYYEIEAVNATELERQVADTMGKIKQLPQCMKNGWLSTYKLKLYYMRTAMLTVAGLKRVMP